MLGHGDGLATLVEHLDVGARAPTLLVHFRHRVGDVHRVVYEDRSGERGDFLAPGIAVVNRDRRQYGQRQRIGQVLVVAERDREMVVTAPCLASCEIAASLANRFGIIVGRRKWVNQMHSVAREHGYGERISGFYHVELGVNDFQADHAETERRLVAAGRKAVEEDYAEALILGCTLEIGFYRDVEKAVGVPVIDPSIAAMKRAEYAANLKRQCGWVPGRMWSCEAPPEDEIARFGGFDNGDAFAQRLIVEAE